MTDGRGYSIYSARIAEVRKQLRALDALDARGLHPELTDHNAARREKLTVELEQLYAKESRQPKG